MRKFFSIFFALALVLSMAANADAARKHRDKDCSDFATWEEAQKFFERHGGPEKDPHGLDRDKDGIACDNLPGAPKDDDNGGDNGDNGDNGGDNGGGDDDGNGGGDDNGNGGNDDNDGNGGDNGSGDDNNGNQGGNDNKGGDDSKGSDDNKGGSVNKPGSSQQGGKLPKTATSYPTLALIGLVILAAGVGLLARRVIA